MSGPVPPTPVVQVLDWVAQRRKAIRGAAVSGLTALAVALVDGHVSTVEAIGLAVAVIAPGQVIYWSKNQPKGGAQ